jgi:isopenicillin N synthase-like dioxygenase
MTIFDLNEDVDPNELVKFLHETSYLVVRDNLVSEDDNNNFLDLMEQYFEQDENKKMEDARPELGYQVGVTPEKKELSRCSQDPNCIKHIETQEQQNRAQISLVPDPKWRYFWRIGSIDKRSNFEKLNSDNVIPSEFSGTWPKVMNNWGEKMLTVIKKVTKIVERGLGTRENELSSLLIGGSHLLAPTGTDVSKYNKLNQVYAGYHYDISFLTIHGKSRYPGLNIWLRNGEKTNIKIPDGCLLIQVGKQLEWLTGGYFTAGYHEVICKEETLQALNKNRSKWRVSSTLFSHVHSDKELYPVSSMRNEISVLMYPKIKEGNFIENELKFIKLLGN